MTTYASPDDVAARWGRTPTDEETALITARLADVERMILRRIPDLADQITAETIDVEDVIQVEADAVLRLVRNPEGFFSESDGSYSYMFSREMASGRLDILPEEWAVLGVTYAFKMFAIDPNIVTPTVSSAYDAFYQGG